MFPALIGVIWLDIILVALLFGFGFAAGSALFSGILGLFRRGNQGA